MTAENDRDFAALPRGWDLGQCEDEVVAAVAVQWIFDNRYFILRTADLIMSQSERVRHAWEAQDVVAGMAIRASQGNGLAKSLRDHIAYHNRRILDPKGPISCHIRWMVGE